MTNFRSGKKNLQESGARLCVLQHLGCVPPHVHALSERGQTGGCVSAALAEARAQDEGVMLQRSRFSESLVCLSVTSSVLLPHLPRAPSLRLYWVSQEQVWTSNHGFRPQARIGLFNTVLTVFITGGIF